MTPSVNNIDIPYYTFMRLMRRSDCKREEDVHERNRSPSHILPICVYILTLFKYKIVLHIVFYLIDTEYTSVSVFCIYFCLLGKYLCCMSTTLVPDVILKC